MREKRLGEAALDASPEEPTVVSLPVLVGSQGAVRVTVMDEQLRPLAELSFPTKLTTYLAAGRPVLLHTPAYASLKNFHEKYRFGLCTSSLEPTNLAGAIEKLAKDETFYRASVTEGQRALHAEFTESTFRTAFQQFLGVDTDADGAKAPHSTAVSATNS